MHARGMRARRAGRQPTTRQATRQSDVRAVGRPSSQQSLRAMSYVRLTGKFDRDPGRTLGQ